MAEYIAHHGIKGQKWYVRRFQNEDGSLTPEGRIRYGHDLLKKSSTSNLEKFGKDKDHNVLYVTGYSGSGKTTLADSMAKNNDAIIHLDSYFRPNRNPKILKVYESEMNNEFDSHLNKVFPGWKKKLLNASDRFEIKDGKVTLKENYLKEVNRLRSAIESFGQEKFKSGNRVLVEGVQIKDGWLSKDAGYYLDKPLVVVGTSQKDSISRQWARDRVNEGRDPHFKNEREVLNWYMKKYRDPLSKAKNDLDEFTRELTYEKGKKFVKELLK